MGVCLGKLQGGGSVNVQQPPPPPPPPPIAEISPTSSEVPNAKAKASHVAPQPSSAPPTDTRPAIEASPPALKPTPSSGPPKLQRSMTASARTSGKRATFAISGSSAGGGRLLSPAAAAALTVAEGSAATRQQPAATVNAPAPPPQPVAKEKSRHLSIRPELKRVGSTRQTDEKRRGKKTVNVTLDVLLKDERARVGFFRFLEATALEQSLQQDPPVDEHPLDAKAKLKRRASRLTQARSTVDYREDCVLFWLEISDLLKIPPGGSFQLGLMRDLFDVYIAKNAPRLLPMVSSAEREPLAQYLQDKQTDRALLAFKMLLLDVLEIVTTAFDEYVRRDGKLGFVHATRSESMRNVLARIATVATSSSDRRSQLNDLLNTPALCRMFREFLQERNSVENLLFIIDSLAFEDLVNSLEKENSEAPRSDADVASRQDYCVRQAQKIFTKYIRYGSKAEICLGNAVKEKLLREIVELPIGAQVFNDAVLLCSAELVQSHLDVFYRSQAYVQYQAARKEAQAQANPPAAVSRRQSASITRRHSQPLDDPHNQYTPALGDILTGVGVNFFRDFLKLEGVENTLLFYKEVEQFQLLPHGQKHYIQIKARKIFDRFVRRGGKLEIELPTDVRRDILFKLSSPSEFTFVDALKYVVHMWEVRYLPRMKEHPLYKDMLTAMSATPASSTAITSSVDIATRRDGLHLQAGGASSATAASAVPAPSVDGDWVDVTKITLREFLELEFLRKYFRHFLEKEQCVNELHFYFEIANYQQLPTSDYLTRQAKKLYSRFCDPQSRECVTLRDDVVAEMQQYLARPSPAMFNKTQDEIFGFFQSTLFPKFQLSEIYRSIQLTHSQLRAGKLAAMGAPDNEIGGRRGGGGVGGGGATARSDGGETPGSPTTRANRRSVTALPELPEESVTVAMILEHQETRSLFLLFAEEIFCTESIYFWLDCNEYKDIPHRNYLKLRAQKIYRKYISGRAKLQVNLESAIIKEIVKNLDDPSRNLFIIAQRSITKMLERDTLPKFRKSKHFQPCMLTLRAAMVPG